MTAIKVNSFLWNALSDEDKKSIESYFNPDNLDDLSISPDPEFPVPNAESVIYRLTEKELHELTDYEIKCRLKYIEGAASDIHYLVSRYHNAALLVCLGIISEEYKKNIDNDAIFCVEITEDESKHYDDLLREIAGKKEQFNNESKEIFKVKIGDISTMKLLSLTIKKDDDEKLIRKHSRRWSPGFAESPDYSGWTKAVWREYNGFSFWCYATFDCKNKVYSYPCSDCRRSYN